jgi:arylsulfatase A-like enzyme
VSSGVRRFWHGKACLLLICSCRDQSGEVSSTSDPAGMRQYDASASSSHLTVLDVVHSLDRCSFGHRGLLLDFGDASTEVNVNANLPHLAANEAVEIEGATWLRLRSRSVATSFYWPSILNEPSQQPIYVEARVRGISAHSMSIAIDGRPVGRWPLEKREARITLARTPGLSLEAGPHELSLRLSGGSPTGDEALVDVDWVHLGVGDSLEPYAAPTRQDVLVDPAPGGRSMQALAIRSPGFARCSGWIPADAKFEAYLAVEGDGDADVEARILVDRRAPVVLGTAHVTGAAAWSPWSVPITGLDGAGAIASIEIVVRRSSKGTRVLFGAPMVVETASPTAGADRTANGVLVVVLGSTSARALGPWGGPHSVPALTNLAAVGTTFLANRAPSSLSNAVVASMLTGLPPSALRLDGSLDRLDESITLVSDACRQGGITTAMFTADPTTGAVFGFDRGWDTFVLHDLLEDEPATRVFDDAREWLDAHRADRFFIFIDARGGHPPWDASSEDLKTMAPAGYLGFIDGPRAAEALAKARRHPSRFRDDDRVRAWALHDHALDQHDAALGGLLTELQAVGRDRDTVVIVTGDVGANEGAPVPFTDPDTLDEPVLQTPLVVRWPSWSGVAGHRLDVATSPLDLARTVVQSLGLSSPPDFQGVDLASLATGRVAPAQRPLVATRGTHYSVRWGEYVLVGVGGSELRMCDLSLDPACVADVRGTSPLALESIRRYAPFGWRRHEPPQTVPQASLDGRSLASLVRWGRLTQDAPKQ